MSNLEEKPDETVGISQGIGNTGSVLDGTRTGSGLEILEPRDVPLGGPRAMTVRRTLPQRSRSLIGAWCFVDHYGPDDVTTSPGMVVPPHPHTGLQTVSWLFAGEVEHRDSAGSHAMVRPGELNLMTAGRGIQHSEVSTKQTATLHGAQLWVALPDASRHTDPHFEHVVPEPVEFGGATVRVFMGSLAGSTSPAGVYTRIVGAQLDLPPLTTVTLPVDGAFEHGLLVDAGQPTVDGHPVAVGRLAYLPPGSPELTLTSGDDPVRALLIGGEPLGEQIVMWWNFIGRSHDEIVEFRRQWQAEVIDGGNRRGRFGEVRGYDGAPLTAPELPTVRLKPRQ